jgi:hypothetical protein
MEAILTAPLSKQLKVPTSQLDNMDAGVAVKGALGLTYRLSFFLQESNPIKKNAIAIVLYIRFFMLMNFILIVCN